MDSFGYKLVFLLHVASFVVAFAPVVVGLLPGDGAATTTLRAAGRTIYAPALILTGLFGILLILLSDEVWEFSDLWVSLAFLLWIAMNGVFHGLILPQLRGRGTRGGGTTAIDLERATQILTVLFLIMLYLMIWKPGR
ncbi:MAG TPA: hypothetical protein VKA65_01365 [Acidimicrobiales bacterium]|jgi:uncharacterized membrane protein|nr:hypothetical protein [Acidimicrobiales bacterium]